MTYLLLLGLSANAGCNGSNAPKIDLDWWQGRSAEEGFVQTQHDPPKVIRCSQELIDEYVALKAQEAKLLACVYLTGCKKWKKGAVQTCRDELIGKKPL